MHTPISARARTHTHTYNSDKKLSSQFITAMGLDNSHISPTLLKALTGQFTCTPSSDLWHFLYNPITYPLTSIPKILEGCSSKTMTSSYKATLCHKPEH